MGFGTQQFVQDVDPNLLCAVCGGVLEDAVLTPCGHSFCSLCLHTWLARPAALTCPECRTQVSCQSIKPVHSLRNLIRGLHVQCEHGNRGCKDVLKLDALPAHLLVCPYAPVQCAGCGKEVSRFALGEHQMTCPAIAAAMGVDHGNDDDDVNENSPEVDERLDCAWRKFRDRVQTNRKASYADVCVLLGRIRALETRVESLLEQVRAVRNKNVALEKEYEKVSGQLRYKHSDLRHAQDTEFFLEHECARSPETVAKLSLLIARHLLKKPVYVDSDKAFCAVHQCYEKFRARQDYQHDVHMLLATAYASNWFSSCDRLSLKCWLNALSRPPPRPASSLFNRS